MKTNRTLPSALLIVGLCLAPPDLNAQYQMEILKHWAPEVYQDMNASKSPWWAGTRQYYSARDAMVTVNFDGDWYTGNNWDNSHYQTWEQGQLNDRNTPPLHGAAYTSFVESDKFYFLGYGFYHSGDDSNISADRHENDWEGLMMVIRKNGSLYGEFKAMVTQLHREIKEYIGTDLTWNGTHPKIYISANGTFDLTSPNKHGHGVERFTNSGYQDDQGSDGVVYQAADYGDNVLAIDIPGADNWNNARRYNYKLISINELWNRRWDPDTYNAYARFQGGISGIDDGGNPPWEKAFLSDPVSYFQTIDKFNFLDGDLSSDTYRFNPYYGNNSSQTDNDNPNEILPPLSGWTGQSIGGSGKIYAANGTFTIDGKGSDIWNASDEFYFVYQTLAGDGEISAKVYSVQDIDQWTKAGVMIRESLAQNSKMVMTAVRPDMFSFLNVRTATSGNTIRPASGSDPSDNRPVHLRLKRTGDNFVSYYSANGNSWTEIGSVTVSMPGNVHIGLAVTSHNSTEFASAVFEEVSVSGASSVARLASVSEDNRVLMTGLEKKVKVVTSDKDLLDQVELFVYDLQGRLHLRTQLSARSEQQVEVLSRPGAYVVKLVDAEGAVRSKKVWIK